MYAIAHSPDPGRYVSVGEFGRILYSDTLPAFEEAETVFGTPTSDDISGNLRAVAYGDGRWVAVGEGGEAHLSPNDGVTWQAAIVSPGTTPGEDPDAANLKAMIYRP